MYKLLFAMALSIAVASGSQSLAATYEIAPSEDGWVYSFAADENYGSNPGVATDIHNMSHAGFAYFKFTLPAFRNEIVQSATLYLYQFDGAGYGEGPTAVQLLSNNNWSEATITWNNKPGGTFTGLATCNDGHSHRGWSSWTFPWNSAYGSTFTLRLAENSSGDQSHWWYSKEYASLAPRLEISTTFSPASVGIYKNGIWYLDQSGNGAWDGTPTDGLYYFGGGLVGAVPVTGDWTGTGTMKIGVFVNGEWYLDLNGVRAWDGSPTDGLYYFGGGLAGAVPVTGDWTGTGATKIGVYVDGVWYLDKSGNGAWDGTPTDGLYYFGGGLAGAVPVTGDWTGTGVTRIGIYANGVWYLDLNGNGAWDGTPTDGLYYFGGGLAGAVPVTGDWTGTGTTNIGVYVNGVWYLDQSGNGAWDGTPTDGLYYFGGGLAQAVPVAVK